MRHALDELDPAEPVAVEVNSIGGVAAEGVAIYNLLRARKVTATVTGQAYSAASFILMAADHVTMQAGATLMIHAPWRLTLGNAEEHRRSVAHLDTMTKQYAAIYAARAGKPAAALERMLAEETYFDGAAAVKAGLADAAEAPKGRPAGNRAAAVVALARLALSEGA